MQSGYAYEYTGDVPWQASDSEPWDIVVYTSDGGEVYQGPKWIDGSKCRVYLCNDGGYRA